MSTDPSFSSRHDATMSAGMASISSSFTLKRQPYVATMTVCAKTTFRAPSLDSLETALGAAFAGAKRFRNCIIVKQPKESTVYGCNVTTKVFVNGVLHMTGPTSMSVATSAADDILLALYMMMGINGEVTGTEITMINTSFATPRYVFVLYCYLTTCLVLLFDNMFVLLFDKMICIVI